LPIGCPAWLRRESPGRAVSTIWLTYDSIRIVSSSKTRPLSAASPCVSPLEGDATVRREANDGKDPTNGRQRRVSSAAVCGTRGTGHPCQGTLPAALGEFAGGSSSGPQAERNNINHVSMKRGGKSRLLSYGCTWCKGRQGADRECQATNMPSPT